MSGRPRKPTVVRSRVARVTALAVVATLAVGIGGAFTGPAAADSLLPPTTPTGLAVVHSTECGGGQIYVGDANPTLSATATDPNGLSQIGITFTLDTVPAGTDPQQATIYGTPGAAIEWQPSSLPNGNYQVTAQAVTDDTSAGATNVTSGTTAPISFTVDTTSPATPTISSTDFPPNAWGGPGGTINLSSASSNIAGFEYSLNGSIPVLVDGQCPSAAPFSPSGGWVDASDGTATLTIPGSGANSLSHGPWTLTVAAFDQAHNISEQSTYTFYVAQPSNPPPPVPEPGTWGGYGPFRVLDTRKGVGAFGALAAKSSLTVTIYPLVFVTTDVSAVVLNLTATAPTAAGYLTAYAGGANRPATSTVNFTRGQTAANLAVVPVGPDDTITLYNGSAGTVQAVADISGYYVGGMPTAPGAFKLVSPTRLLDTRINKGSTGPVASNGTVHLASTSSRVPADASAVVLNVTVTQPRRSGDIAVYPDGTLKPVVSNLNFVAGQTIANLVVVKVGTNSKVSLTNNSPGSVQLVADIIGYYLGGGTPTHEGVFVPVAPTRLMDTRSNLGAMGPIATHSTARLHVSGGVVPVGALGVVLNVTVTQPATAGNIAVYPGIDSAEPATSNLNFLRGQTIANLVMVEITGDGEVALTNNGAGSVQVVADVAGYYLD